MLKREEILIHRGRYRYTAAVRNEATHYTQQTHRPRPALGLFSF